MTMRFEIFLGGPNRGHICTEMETVGGLIKHAARICAIDANLDPATLTLSSDTPHWKRRTNTRSVWLCCVWFVLGGIRLINAGNNPRFDPALVLLYSFFQICYCFVCILICGFWMQKKNLIILFNRLVA